MKILYFIALLFILVSVSYSQSDTASLNLSENNIFDKVASGENHKLDVASNLIDLYNFKKLPEESIKRRDILDTSYYHSAYPEYIRRTTLWLPIAEVVGFNAGLGMFNNYISGEEFAKISFASVRHNLDTGFVWDNDVFVTNQFLHPYHGNLYFNAARGNGYSYWESVPFSFGGSLMWEMFMETDPPQANDLIQTTLGGIMVGEITYRLSSLVIDESKTGFKRVFAEALGFLIDPMRGFNRLIHGEMARVTPRNVNDVFPLFATMNIGYAGMNPSESIRFEKHHIMLEFILTYGNPLKVDIIKPMDFFRLKMGFDARKGDDPASWVYAYGLIWGKNIIKNPEKRFVIGVFHDYDFFYNELYRLGAQSVGIGFIYLSPQKEDFKFMASVHTNFIALAALNSIYRAGESRDYDWCFGNKSMAELLGTYGIVNLGLEYRVYILKTINGWAGHSTLGVLNPKVFVSVAKDIAIGAEYLFYHRYGLFENVPAFGDVSYNKRISEQRLYLKFTF